MTKALALFSGGLDSILACRMVMKQGIEVIGITFVTPFFQYHLLENQAAYRQMIFEKYQIPVVVEDISPGYLHMLQHPPHGFGKSFNPCIDCKIIMLQRAKVMLSQFGASFLISGEVLGQRPMSQRRDTLNVIERDSGSRSILLRPLSAKYMTPTLPETEGWVDRQQLGNLSGRGRSDQIALAQEYGITDFPHPAGGCILTDPIFGHRIKQLYAEHLNLRLSDFSVSDFRLVQVGRQFRLPKGGWLVLGRIEKENVKIAAFAGAGDVLMYMEERPGPTALLRKADLSYRSQEDYLEDVQAAASLVVRYGKKVDGKREESEVKCERDGKSWYVDSQPAEDGACQQWML